MNAPQNSSAFITTDFTISFHKPEMLEANCILRPTATLLVWRDVNAFLFETGDSFNKSKRAPA